MDFLKKCGQCLCYAPGTCNCSCFVDCWWSTEAQGLAGLYCCACCWTVCSPLCIECKMGDCGKGWQECLKGLKYCAFSCATAFAAPFDGCYTCIQTMIASCKDGGIKEFNTSIKPTFTLLSEKIKSCMQLEVSVQPMKSFSTFTP